MESAIHPLDNCDHKSEHYLWGFFCFIYYIYSHSFTNRMAKSGSSENASSEKVDETGTPLQQGRKKSGSRQYLRLQFQAVELYFIYQITY